MSRDARKLANAERFAPTGLFGSSEKKRDQVAAQRAIEGLSQNDQIIGLLTEQNALLSRQNEMLDFLCRRIDPPRM